MFEQTDKCAEKHLLELPRFYLAAKNIQKLKVKSSLTPLFNMYGIKGVTFVLGLRMVEC